MSRLIGRVIETLGTARICEESPMQSTISRTYAAGSLLNIRRLALPWIITGTVLTLGGCVSQQTYESAREETKTQANELSQVQAEIQSLAQQRDETHAANQRDERALGILNSELKSMRVSLEEIRKSHQAKLAAIRHSIAALRAQHQAMLKEISETKRYEKQLEALTARHEQAMATIPTGPEAPVTTVNGLQQEPRMVAIITPQLPPQGLSPAVSPTPAASPLDGSALSGLNPSMATSQTTSTMAAAATPASVPATPAPVAAASASPTAGIPPGPKNESWFSSMTGWLTSMFDWLWS